MPETLTAEKVDELVSGVQSATKALEDGRKKMDEANEQVGKLLKQQEALKEDATTKGEAIKRAEEQLRELAERMTTIADGHTELTHRIRQHMKTLGQDGGSEEQAFIARNGRGTIFESRRQAIEVGMFFMATMKRQDEIRAGARQWLKDHKNDLRYLPNIPLSFVQELGQEWHQQYVDLSRGRIGIQDLSGGVNPGNILVQPEFRNVLIRNVEEYGAFRRNATIWPMGSDTVYVPRRQSGFSVYWEGEAESTTESDPDVQLLGMTAKKMMSFHQYSSELSEDAAISLADIIAFEMAQAVAYEEDRIGFNGTGAGGNATSGYAGFFGLLGLAANATAATADTSHVPHLVTGAGGNDLTTEITEAKLREMTGRLHTWAQNAKWFMHRSVHADCDGIQMGTAGGSVVRYQDGKSASIMGYPIENVEALPASPSSASTKVFGLGDMRKAAILGDRRRMEVQTSEHYAFNTDQLSVRMTNRISFLWISAEGMVVYRTGTA